jgi:hypothetical protein
VAGQRVIPRWQSPAQVRLCLPVETSARGCGRASWVSGWVSVKVAYRLALRQIECAHHHDEGNEACRRCCEGAVRFLLL